MRQAYSIVPLHASFILATSTVYDFHCTVRSSWRVECHSLSETPVRKHRCRRCGIFRTRVKKKPTQQHVRDMTSQSRFRNVDFDEDELKVFPRKARHRETMFPRGVSFIMYILMYLNELLCTVRANVYAMRIIIVHHFQEILDLQCIRRIRSKWMGTYLRIESDAVTQLVRSVKPNADGANVPVFVGCTIWDKVAQSLGSDEERSLSESTYIRFRQYSFNCA